MIVVFRNLLEHDISNLYLPYSFVFTFTNIFLTIRQEQTSLLNHCLSTQKRPHARPRAMPRAVFSFKNNNPFYYKQSSAVKTIAAKFKQWLRAFTYCYKARSRSLTLLASSLIGLGTWFINQSYNLLSLPLTCGRELLISCC